MFMTNPSFEDRALPGLGSREERYWRMMLLTIESPWYLVSYKVGAGMEEMTQTAVVAWESTLLALVEQIGSTRVTSLRCILRSHQRPGDWLMDAVAEVWLPSDDEVDRVGPMLFRFFERPGIYDSFHVLAEESSSRRQLLNLCQ